MSDEIIALVPAAGFATRLGELPCSKELLPAGWRAGREIAPDDEPLAGHLLSRLAAGGIRRALVITRREKEDIPRRLGDGRDWGVELDYLLIGPTASTVETLDAAHRHVGEAVVALGYPDIVFRPMGAYSRVIDTLSSTGADIALGLFPSDQPEKSDMVELAPDGTIRRIVIKQPDRGLEMTWSIALWRPRFTEILHRFVRLAGKRKQELYVGDVISAAMAEGMSVVGHPFRDGHSSDLGTPEALRHPPDWLVSD